MEKTLYTTIVVGNNGKLYDLGKFEFIPADVIAINAYGARVQTSTEEEKGKKKKKK